jgi:uncharacterized protein
VKTALVDLNILTALLWPAHEYHDAAHRWAAERRRARWATCTLTQLGFLRLVSNPSFSRDALPPASALALLIENLGQPTHEFWPEDVPVADMVTGMEGALQGYRHLTDAYLLALAHRRKGVLATFDRGIRALAGDARKDALEIVPIR